VLRCEKMPPLNEDASYYDIASAHIRLWVSKRDWTKQLVLFIASAYVVFKCFAIPSLFVRDLDMQMAPWESHTTNTSTRSCQLCLDLAISGNVPPGVFALELTHCFDKFGDTVMVDRPHEATIGEPRESWKRSWHDHEEDWWSRHPLDKSVAKFDSRWLMPNFRHQQVLRIGAWWPDYLIIPFITAIGIFAAVLVNTGYTHTRWAIIISSVVIAAFTPYFAYRLGQSYGWQVVRVTPLTEFNAGCAHVFWGNEQFTSFSFYMLCAFYACMVLMIAPCVTKWYADDAVEGDAGLICEAVVALIGFTMGTIFLSDIKSNQSENSSYDILNAWMLTFIICLFDCVVLVPLFLLIFKILGKDETFEDKVMPF